MTKFDSRLSRRDFLRISSLLAASLAFPGCTRFGQVRNKASSPEDGLLLSPTPHKVGDSPLTYFAFYDIAKRKQFKIPVPLKTGHAAFGHPLKRNLIMIAEKAGQNCCELDLGSRSVARIITADAGRKFYGHGAYSADGSRLFLSEVSTADQGKGFITIRDHETLRVVGEVESFGLLPHDMHLIEDGKALLIANQGKNPGSTPEYLGGSVTIVELASGKLRHKFPLEEKNVSAAHVAAFANGRIVVGANSYIERHDDEARKVRELLNNPKTYQEGVLRRGEYEEYFAAPLYSGEINGRLQNLSDPGLFAKMKYTLGLAVDDRRGIAAATHVFGNTISFWRVQAGELIGSHTFPEERPNGVALLPGGTHFAMTTSQDKLYFIDAETLKIDSEMPMGVPLLAGSHITAWKV